MPNISFLLPILIYFVLIVLGVAVAIHLISFLRIATRYFELKVREIEDRSGERL